MLAAIWLTHICIQNQDGSRSAQWKNETKDPYGTFDLKGGLEKSYFQFSITATR